MADPRQALPAGFEIDPIQALPPGFEVDQQGEDESLDPALATLPAGFEPEVDTWGDIGAKMIENAPAMFKQSIAGMAQKTAESPPNPLSLFVMPSTDGQPTMADALSALQKRGGDWLREKLGMEPDQSAAMASQMYADATADLAENAPNVDPNSIKGFAYDAGTSIIQMVPGLLTAFATKNPAIGAAAMGSQVSGQRYGQSRTEGRTPQEASQDAMVFGLAEGVPEMMPLGFLMKPGGKFLMRTLKTAGAEGLSEIFTQAIQDGYSAGILDEKMTWGQAFENMKRAGLLGAAVGGGVATVTHPFTRGEAPATDETGAAPGGVDAAAATGTPTPIAGGEPSPPAAAAAATIPPATTETVAPEPERRGPWSKPLAKVGNTVGLKQEEGPPERVEIESIQDGYVFFRREDGSQDAAREDQFQRDLTTPPPPRRGVTGSAVPSGALPDAPLPTESDINDFDPYAVREPTKTRQQAPSPQGSMALPETRQIQVLRDAATANLKLAAEAERIGQKTPQEIAAYKVEAAKLMDEAAALERRITPARASQDPTAATAEQLAGSRIGPLGRAAPAQSEATTGPQAFQVTPRQQPAAAQPQLAPVARSEAEVPQEPQFRQKTQVPWQQRLREQIGNRKASLNDPVAMARNLGTTPEAVTKELQGIAASRGAPIETVRTVGAKNFGKWRYTPRPTGKATQSLSDFVYDSGGMAAGSFAGELEARDLHTAKRPFKGTLIKPAARMNVQDMADNAQQSGFPIPLDNTGDHADVDAFLNMLEQDHAGSRKFYVPGTEPEAVDENAPKKPMTPKERKQAARRQLAALGFEPKGETIEELEGQLDTILDAVGANEAVDVLNFARATEVAVTDRMSQEAQDALRQEAGNDYPSEYDDAWFAAEIGEGSPSAQYAPDERVQEGGEQAGTQPEGQERAPGGNESAAEIAPEAGQEPATGGVIARLLKDESGAVPLPDWDKIKAYFSRGNRQQTPQQVASSAPKLGAPNRLRSFGLMARWLRSGISLAAIDQPSSVYWNANLDQENTKNTLEREAIDTAKPYFRLDAKAKARIHKILEYARLYGVEMKNTGRDLVVKIPDRKPPFGEGRPELAKPGEIIALDRAETQAFFALRRMFDQSLMNMGAAMAAERGYTGQFDRKAIESAIKGAQHPTLRRRAEAAMDALEAVEEMRKAGYVPFQRYGDAWIAVKPKTPKSGLPETARFELIDTRSVFDSLFSRKGGRSTKPLTDRIEELRKQFPENDYEITHGEVTPSLFQNLNLPALEKALIALDTNDVAGKQKLVDNLMHEVFEQRKAGFRKQSQNVPGYSVDFERAIADYMRQTSAVAARMAHRTDVDSAYDGVQRHPVKEVRDYWRAFKEHQESSSDDFGMLRKIGFFMFLWGTPASAAVNLTQTPLVTMSQLATWAGPRAAGLANGAMVEALRKVKIGQEGSALMSREGLRNVARHSRGFTVDIGEIGKTPAEQAMLSELESEGVLSPQVMEDFGAGRLSEGSSSKLRPALKRMDRVYDIGASMFNTTETVNRVAAALAYFRAAQNPQLRQKMTEVYKNDENFKEIVARHGLTPTAIARFGVNETQFIGGKMGRPQAARGFGALLLQFKNFVMNYLRLMHKNFRSMGPQGKLAGSFMLMSLFLIGGLAGIPFGEDAIKAYDTLYEGATGIDPDIEWQIREFMRDHGFGEYGAEVATRGFGQDVFGLDMTRLGMGNLFPDNSVSSLMPIVTGTVGRLSEAEDRWNTGQPVGALAAVLGAIGGKGLQDVVKGTMVYPNEGISTKRGNWTVMPGDVTLADMTMRALGFQPSKATRASQAEYHAGRIANATQGARTAMLTQIARLVVLGMDARQAGDTETADEYSRQIEQLYQGNAAQLIDPSIPDWQKIKPAQRQAVKQRVMSLIKPEIANIRRASKMSRPSLLESPFNQPVGDQ